MINNDLRSLWEQRLAEYESSSKTIAAWCQEHSIRYHQFHYWRRKLRVDQTVEGQPVKWLSLELDNGKQVSLAPDSIAVHIGQVTIELKNGFDQQLFREIVQVLQKLRRKIEWMKTKNDLLTNAVTIETELKSCRKTRMI